MPDHSLILLIAGAILAMTGLAGMLLPFVPGAPLLFLGAAIAAWAEDFRYVGAGTLAILAGLMSLTYLIEFIASAAGVRKYGGSRRAMLGAALGGIVGIFLGLPGILFGPLVGAVLGELTLRRDLNRAGRAGFGTVVGLAIGLAGKLAIGLSMIGIFLFARFYSV